MVGKLFLLGVLAIAFALFSAANFKKEEVPIESEKLQISTSFYPLYFFTSQIAGEKAIVNNLSKVGADPHDFEPSVNDLRTLSESQLLITNGVGFETWLEDFAKQIDSKTEIIATATDIAYLSNEHDEHEESHEDEHEDEHDHGVIDPHVWLDPLLAKQQVEVITQAIIKHDEASADYYRENSRQLQEKLDLLHETYIERLRNCGKDTVITAHAAFAYVAERYGFEQIAIQGLSPEEEPSPAKLAEISQVARQLGITHVFFENTLSPRVAETLATEIGAQTLLFHPLENLSEEDVTNGADYFSIQYQNSSNLQKAMQCQ